MFWCCLLWWIEDRCVFVGGFVIDNCVLLLFIGCDDIYDCIFGFRYLVVVMFD